jgi:hypothetical protein
MGSCTRPFPTLQTGRQLSWYEVSGPSTSDKFVFLPETWRARICIVELLMMGDRGGQASRRQVRRGRLREAREIVKTGWSRQASHGPSKRAVRAWRARDGTRGDLGPLIGLLPLHLFTAPHLSCRLRPWLATAGRVPVPLLRQFRGSASLLLFPSQISCFRKLGGLDFAASLACVKLLPGTFV